MANTYTQIHIHAVFAPKYRQACLDKAWRPQLCKYITGILQNYGHKMLQINGVDDHLHLFFGMRPTQSLSKLMQQIKEDSSKWIKENKFTPHPFNWQEGYGAFSHSWSQVPIVINYVKNQEQHHATKTFQEEYLEMLTKFEVDFDEAYILLLLLVYQ